MSAWWGVAGVVSSFSPHNECPAMRVSCSCSLRRIGCQSAGSLVAVQVQDCVKQLIIYCFCLFICRYSNNSQQVKLSSMMWKIWPCLPDYGRRAAQFVDLLGYFTIKCESNTDEVLTSFLWINLVLNWSAWGQTSPIKPLYSGENTDNIYNEWSPHCLSKRQLLSTTVLFRTTSTQTIILHLLMKWLLGSNLLQFIMRQV